MRFSLVDNVSFCRHSLFLVAALAIVFTHAAMPLTDSSVVSLLTVSPGEPLYSAFGHTGIRVKDSAKGLDVVFNYGTFDDTQDGFYINFVKGKMLYGVTYDLFPDFMWQYENYEKRRVVEQIVHLSLEDRQKVFDLLAENVKPENAKYYYDFFWDNCATRPRDVFEKVLVNRLQYNEEVLKNDFTMRQTLHQYVDARPWVAFGFDLILGLPCEVPATPRNQTFLPDRLSTLFAYAKVDSTALVSSTNVLVDLPEVKIDSSAFTPMVFTFGLFVIGVLIGLWERFKNTHLWWFDVGVFFVYGFLGVFFLSLWAFTTHYSVPKNLNVLWLMPTHLVVALLMMRNNKPSWLSIYMMLTLAAMLLLLLGWKWNPQPYNVAVIPLLLLIANRALKIIVRLKQTSH